jgi:hypothetical protein
MRTEMTIEEADEVIESLKSMLIAARTERDRLKAALQTIASYGKDHGGCCPYGCDCPHIAQVELGQAAE